jgi:hypothetical protein
MNYTLCDSRALAAVVIQPATGKLYNWASTGWDPQPIAAAHILPFAALAAKPSVLADFQTADVGTILLQPDVAMLFFTVDKNGSPVAGVDVGMLPNPVSNPIFGVCSR